MKKYMIIGLFIMAAFFPILFIPLIPMLGLALVFSLIDTLHTSNHGLFETMHGEDHHVSNTGLSSLG